MQKLHRADNHRTDQNAATRFTNGQFCYCINDCIAWDGASVLTNGSLGSFGVG